MSLVPKIEKLPDEQPQTHVFIVAVGHYRFLKDGETPVLQKKFDDIGFGQLSSPSISARLLYDTIIEIHQTKGWVKPLGSIELLVSASDNLFPEINVERASIVNVSNRYAEWKDRCDKHKDNVALFFFCGHGLEKFSHYLLTDDFGENGNNPWVGSFDFDLTRSAFHECKAETQIFFVDACRQATASMLLHNIAIAPIDQPSHLAPNCRYDATIKATAHNAASYAKQGKASFFTQALIKGLKGDAASSENDLWHVSTNNLGTALNKVISIIQPDEDFDQRCVAVISVSSDIIQLSSPPTVTLEISCYPDDAIGFAALSYQHMDKAEIQDSRIPQPSPWLVNVEAGIYRLGANFADPSYKSIVKHASVAPPFTKEKLKCHG